MPEMNEQIAQLKANSTRFANAGTRQVIGGYVVSGQTQYQDKDTKGIVLTENAEAVAASVQDAVNMVANYLTRSSFDAPAQQADSAQGNMFGAQPNPASI